MSETRPAYIAYRDPVDLPARDVCPHCKTETEIFLISCDGHLVEAHRCRRHGDIVPMRSAIHYPQPATPGNVWDGEGP